MNNTQYFQEADKWINDPHYIVPNKAFALKYMDRVGMAWMKAEKSGYHNDSCDYHAWGWALTNDIHYNGEDDARELNQWAEFYNQCKGKNLPKEGNKIPIYLYEPIGTTTLHKVSGNMAWDEDLYAVTLEVWAGTDNQELYRVYWNDEDERWEFQDGYLSS